MILTIVAKSKTKYSVEKFYQIIKISINSNAKLTLEVVVVVIEYSNEMHFVMLYFTKTTKKILVLLYKKWLIVLKIGLLH